MKRSRRQFLKVASLSVAGLGAQLAAGGMTKAAAAVKPSYKEDALALKAKRWAMVIDTREFASKEDFDACINACNHAHNIPNIPGKSEIKWIWKDAYEHTFTETKNKYQSKEIEDREYFMLCNHCENPPCVRVCPTQATYKLENGIVAMDYHRCIGCRFCMAGCPFGARSFNFTDPRPYIKDINPKFPTRMIGVVEKCNFCVERLDEGKLPACVEAAPGKIHFGDLSDPESEVRKLLEENYTLRRKPALGTEPGVFYII
ncbi:sulfate reduction electron transfer complex DsrMKJOP subunit DsrO [Halodesulfovibrio sp.]|uniref:sulfate reduction electron transfer complex DsrMKJOP subunit DsrO n=1 Tax=Halodesulfovibrio sp. TaxID=1912772 RepID=UPI0025BD0381|nr:4Fe-4S dicluster domain-containing protein [Halodesulfovibrio sp.]